MRLWRMRMQLSAWQVTGWAPVVWAVKGLTSGVVGAVPLTEKRSGPGPAGEGSAVNDYARSLPHLGFDPAPGDVGLTQHLARRHYQVAQEARQVLAIIEKLDLRTIQGRAADALRALQATFPPALRNTASAAQALHAATSSWANQLSGFQAEADALDRKAAQASAHQQALQVKQASLPPGSAVLTAELTSASAAVSGIHRQAQELHQRYLAAAAKTAADVGDHSGLWDRTEPIRTVLEAVLAPLDIVAADHWVSALEKVAGVPSEGAASSRAVHRAHRRQARRLVRVRSQLAENRGRVDRRDQGGFLHPERARPDRRRGNDHLAAGQGRHGPGGPRRGDNEWRPDNG